MKKIFLMICAVIFAASVSALEPKSTVSSYCIGVIYEKQEDEPYCGFIIASLNNEDQKISIKTVMYPGNFSNALKAMYDSDIRLSLPTIKGIYVGEAFPEEPLEKSLGEMLSTEGFPPDASVIYCKAPTKLIEEKDSGTNISGAMFIPKFLKNKDKDVSLVSFTDDESKKAPFLSFSNGRFVVQTEDLNG